MAAVLGENIDIVIFHETLLPENKNFTIRNYNSFILPATGGQRDLITLIRRTVPYTLIENPINCGENVEVQTFKLYFENQNITLYNIYKNLGHCLDLTELFDFAGTHTTIIGGDFNAHHPILESPKNTNDDGLHIHELLNTNPHIKLLNTREPTHKRGGSLDQTFTSSTLHNIAEWKVHDTLISDHFATLTNINVPQLPPPHPYSKRWNQNKADWGIFKQALSSWYQQYTPPNNIDQLETDLKNAFHEACDKSMPLFKTPKQNYKDAWYYCDRVKNSKAGLIELAKYAGKNPSVQNREQLQEIARHVQQEFQSIRQNKWMEWCAQLNEHTSLRELWFWLKRVVGKKYKRANNHSQPKQEAKRLAEHCGVHPLISASPQYTTKTKNTQNPQMASHKPGL